MHHVEHHVRPRDVAHFGPAWNNFQPVVDYRTRAIGECGEIEESLADVRAAVPGGARRRHRRPHGGVGARGAAAYSRRDTIYAVWYGCRGWDRTTRGGGGRGRARHGANHAREHAFTMAHGLRQVCVESARARAGHGQVRHLTPAQG